MIRIRPTTVSGLSHANYSIDLPGHINPIRARNKKISFAIDGSLLVSLYRKRVDGAVASTDFNIHPDVYKVLLSIVYHETIFEWLVIVDNKRYICELDLTEDKKITVHGNPDYRQVTISFLIIREVV
jgi:hypothetical protein